MSPVLVANFAQVAVVLIVAPLFQGLIARFEHIVLGKRGPSIWQPYFDLAKWFGKQAVVSKEASWIFHAAPYVAFAAPLAVALLIPVLTSFPLYWAFMGDMMGGGFILGLAGFFVHLAALDTGSPYAGIGSSRARFVSLLAEPVLILVFFAVADVAHATIPYVVNETLAGPAHFLSPSHLLVVIAFFMVLLAEGGRIPVDNPASHHELSQIEKSRLIEYSGPALALLEWGGMAKSFVLAVILMNVLVTPWGLAGSLALPDLALALGALVCKLAVLAAVVSAVETSLAKLRLLRVAEFLGAAFATALLAVATNAAGM